MQDLEPDREPEVLLPPDVAPAHRRDALPHPSFHSTEGTVLTFQLPEIKETSVADPKQFIGSGSICQIILDPNPSFQVVSDTDLFLIQVQVLFRIFLCV